MFQLLDPDGKTGVTLTETHAMLPTASVSGWYIGHPQAHYFGLGLIGSDQIQDYATRRSISVEEAENFLSANLAYNSKQPSQ